MARRRRNGGDMQLFIKFILDPSWTATVMASVMFRVNKIVFFFQVPRLQFYQSLLGIISRMEHLKEIGMDACWLSPIFASPQVWHLQSWVPALQTLIRFIQVDTGYDVSDFYTIEPDYGTMADFDNLMTKANDLGIKLMLDFIPNHTSDQHDWFVKSENNETGFEDYYIWRNPVFEGAVRKEPNNWISVFGGPAWTYSEKRGQWVVQCLTLPIMSLIIGYY